ncbi:hypothetical protein VB773_05750 [Haloarculaceae archaeon H-GB2-1]|nr:hypothetical protein [Haloarculaceae archaeon H-GB1-1]MEA5389070.1 hypothetical protein [Haloarculaceae archaeon H-GB11]MEA5407131.1 hypothetical protein [Haloarculaceae archaeon H-GB2-1]
MAGSIHCDVCEDTVNVQVKDPPGQLILMCDHTTEMFSLDEYDESNLPPSEALGDAWSVE